MPAVPKTSEDDIIAAARDLIARDGAANFSLQDVAAKVGVRTSALYKRFVNREAILHAVAHTVAADLDRLQRRVAVTGSPREDLLAIARAQRKFALRHRHLYDVIFGATLGKTPSAAEASAKSTDILLDRVRQIAKPTEVLAAARLLVAFTHGFISMELADAFRLGGEIDEAFEFGITRVIEGIDRRGPHRLSRQVRRRSSGR